MHRTYKSVFLSFLIWIILFISIIIFQKKILITALFWGTLVWTGVLCSKHSIIQNVCIERIEMRDKFIILVNIILVSILCIAPMDLSPLWNGEIPDHRNQYELLADAILEGHIDIRYDDYDVRLEQMEDPYDPDARREQNIQYHWDHAFYKGHYYMYFGVVPVFLLFIPYKVLFGTSLITFHATQIFVFFSIVAIFLLFYLLAKKFFSGISLGTYLFTTSASACISFGYCTQAPALYCTAISSGFCMMLWSFICFFKAVYYEYKESRQVLFAALGAFLGALAFGCRPPIAIANICAIPLAITYAKNYKGKHLVRNYIIISLPYMSIGALLMLYNYARFQNPFEFGQTYQLTCANQSMYADFWAQFDLIKQINLGFKQFFELGEVTKRFPYLNYGGYLVTYPLMWLLIPFFSQFEVRKALKKDELGLWMFFSILTVALTTFASIQWAPFMIERYRLDGYYIVSIIAFMCIGYKLKTTDYCCKTAQIVEIVCICSILFSILLFFRPFDANFAILYPEKVDEIKRIIFNFFRN
ncbi:hypothetical protein [Butyrivibrio fibrisolvens]|uniref:hypothetical protein n=1 Tax=Butyrivibrio fibrisolvens TaxID=831 RepID=UPI0020BE7952|nr:hypothetical protein [Butyrivibrio fibrisolvens]